MDVTVSDPMGRSLTLHDHTWHGHIALGHPELDDLRALCEEAIAYPDIITVSRSSPACRLYHGLGPRSGVMIVVVADVDQGHVKTAYLCRKIDGGIVEWSSPTA